MEKKEMTELAYRKVKMKLRMMSHKEIIALLPEAKKAMTEIEKSF